MSYTEADLARIRANPDIRVIDDHANTDPKPVIEPTRTIPVHISVTPVKGDAIRLTLPYPPSANVYWRMAKNRRTGQSMMVKSAAANRYIAAVADICDQFGIKPLTGDVVVSNLRVYRPQRSGDLDNRIKVVLDALQGYAYHNDDQIVEIHAYRNDDKDNPRVEIEIQEATP